MKSLLLILFCISITLLTWSQEYSTYYYGANGEIIDSTSKVLVYNGIKLNKNGSATVKTYRKTSTGWMDTRIERIGKEKKGIRTIRYREGTFFARFYKREMKQINPNSYSFKDYKGSRTLKKGYSSTQIPLHYDGVVTRYYTDGIAASESDYQNNYLISNRNWNQDGSSYINNIHYSADKAPVHPFGESFIQSFITTQMTEKEFPLNEVEDELLIGFVIMETGELEGVRILKGKVASVNQFFIETMEALPGLWEPARLDGKKVRYFITMPVSLKNDTPLLQDVEYTKGGQLFWN